MARLLSLPSFDDASLSYRAVAFDLDGTLYDQKKLRTIMAKRLMLHYLCHPFRIRELFLLQTFRKVRDRWEVYADSFEGSTLTLDEQQYAYIASITGVTPAAVEGVVKRWIHEDPLSALPSCVNTALASAIETLRGKGIPVCIVSDYPIPEKLKALGIRADHFYAPGDERKIELKPSPMGLKLLMEDLSLKPEEVLMVGDRDEKDGESARRAGVDYVIV